MIKSVIIFSLLVIVQLSALSQKRTINDIVNQQEIKKGRYILITTSLEAVVINMPFGESTVISMMDKANLKNAEIYQVDVVYSDYPTGIDLMNLNKQRIAKALEARKDLVSNESIKWQLIRQMECKNEAEAKTLFHGVVIHYRPPQSDQMAFTEKRYYDSILPRNDSVKVTNKQLKQFKDTTVTAVLRRNTQWKHATIVTDVTCSMSPFASQLGLWFLYKIHNKEKTNIVLFNDGDGIANHLKVVGKTGGIYTVSTDKYERFLDLLDLATSKGCSGDSPENGVEAILKAQKEFPHSKEIIFIADNYAPMRDTSLISQIKIPVRVIVCGTQFFTNPQYINLAHKTGGSIHSIEQDLTDLSKLSEGKTFKFNKQTFVLKNGEVVPLKTRNETR